jgi:hypothetical protein
MAGGAAIALASPEVADGTPSGDEMTCRASAGEDAPGVGARLRIGPGFAGECVREGRALRCDDSETDSRVDRDRCRKLGIRSVVAVPLKNNESVLGIIEIFSPRTKAFTESHMAKLHVLAERVTSAVEDAKKPPPPMPAVSMPELIWADVFVDSSIPWMRLLQSTVCHLVVVAAVWNISLSWAKSEKILRPTASPNSQLTYYPNSPTFPAAGSRRPLDSAAKLEVQSGQSAAMAVQTASERQTIAPPNVKPSARGPLNLVAENPDIPTMSRPPALSAVTSPQRINLASSGRPSVAQVSIIGPAPQVGEAFRRQGIASLNSVVVAPSPAIEGRIRMAANVEVGNLAAVGPPPGMPVHDGPIGSGMTFGGADAVVGPPPAMPLNERSGVSGVTMGGADVVVGPAPAMPLHERPSMLSAGLGGSGPSVVPPPPSVAGSDGLSSRQVGSPSGSGLQVVVPTPSIAAADALADRNRRAAMNIRTTVTPLPPRLDEPAGRVLDLPVRVLGLALALPSSSYFSNYEVFIAERQIAESESQLIKLVFESRPTQRRVSEYGLKDSKIFKLRVKRDPTCDETAAQVTGNHLSELQNSSSDGALLSTDGESLLPCYRTTADEYQKTPRRR